MTDFITRLQEALDNMQTIDSDDITPEQYARFVDAVLTAVLRERRRLQGLEPVTFDGPYPF